jgi:hypothetical protein
MSIEISKKKSAYNLAKILFTGRLYFVKVKKINTVIIRDAQIPVPLNPS